VKFSGHQFVLRLAYRCVLFCASLLFELWMHAALEYHERARALEPSYGGAYFGCAQVRHSQECYKEALEDYEAALRMRPDMAWQIEPYVDDVKEKIKARALEAEAELLAALDEEEKALEQKASKNKKKKQKQRDKKKKVEEEKRKRAEEQAARRLAEEEVTCSSHLGTLECVGGASGALTSRLVCARHARRSAKPSRCVILCAVDHRPTDWPGIQRR
jgi:tetratricopeptide (TPR) repeat protein